MFRTGVFGCVAYLGICVAGSASAQETQSYSYDVHGRLTSVARSAGGTIRTTTYNIDPADNRTSRATTVTMGASLATLDSAPLSVTPRPAEQLAGRTEGQAGGTASAATTSRPEAGQ